MEVIQSQQLQWKAYPGQRSSTIRHQSVFKGEQKALDNFELSFVRIGEGGCFSPRHRHNFEQFRLPLNGPFSQSPKQKIPQGHLGYVAEGTYYGPQELPAGLEFLILQCAGPTGSGYMSQEELMAGTRELQEAGDFEGGVYRRKEKGAQGERVNQDAYEAVWEHVNGRRLEYPKPRYREPITIDPQAFPWLEEGSGVSRKTFGPFNECGTAAGFLRLERGARHACVAEGGRKLCVVTSGLVACEGREFDVHSAFNLAPGESAQFEGASAEPATLLVLQLARLAS